MPVTIKSTQVNYKDPNTGQYISVDAVAEKTSAGMVADINTTGQQKINQIVTTGTQVLNSIPSDYTNLSNDVNSLKSAFERSKLLYTKTTDYQIFDYDNAVILRRLSAKDTGQVFQSGINNQAIIPIGEINGVQGDVYTYNLITSKTFSELGIINCTFIASAAYPESEGTWLQRGSTSSANKRGTITLGQSSAYLSLNVLITGSDTESFDFTELLQCIVIRKGAYDTTYYPYSILDVKKDNLSPDLQEKINNVLLKTTDYQIFDATNANILRRFAAKDTGSVFATGINNQAIVPIAKVDGLQGDHFTYNFITDKTFAELGISNCTFIASAAYPEDGGVWLQRGSTSSTNRRGTITLGQDAAYLSLNFLITGTDTENFDFSELLNCIVVRKGDYDTTYYPYKMLSVEEFNLSTALQEKINTSSDENAYRQIITRTLTVGQNVLTDASTMLGSNWTGDLTNGFAHTSGSTEPLSFSVATDSTASYLVSFMMTNPIEKSVTVKIGNSAQVDVYNGSADINVGIVSDGGYLYIAPVSTWAGTITNLKLRKVQDTGDEVTLVVKNVNAKTADPGITGFWNVIIGVDNFGKNENGSRNISIGYASLAAFKSGTRNVGVGTFSLSALVAGERNIGLGADALWRATKANDCIAIGKATMEGAGTDLAEDVAIGNGAMGGMTTGKYNVAIGHYAMGAGGQAANNNVCIGKYAGNYAQGNNTDVGYRAGYYHRGTNNTALGYSAGGSLYTDGDNNTFVGANADIDSTGASSANPKTVNNSIAVGKDAKVTKSGQMVLGSSAITEVVMCGNKKIVFNQDGTVTWETIS